jgi:hypothetical protein
VDPRRIPMHGGRPCCRNRICKFSCLHCPTFDCFCCCCKVTWAQPAALWQNCS